MKWAPMVWVGHDGDYTATIREYRPGGHAVVVIGPGGMTAWAEGTVRGAMDHVSDAVDVLRMDRSVATVTGGTATGTTVEFCASDTPGGDA